MPSSRRCFRRGSPEVTGAEELWVAAAILAGAMGIVLYTGRAPVRGGDASRDKNPAAFWVNTIGFGIVLLIVVGFAIYLTIKGT